MKTNRISLAFFLVLTALLGLSDVTLAQVKIGNNHQTIGQNSNLEVEAANGNKTVVDKATGSVGIGTATPSNKLHVTDSADPLKIEGLQTGVNGDVGLVVTADGVVKKAVAEATPLVRFLASLSTTGQVYPTGSTQDVKFHNVDFDTYPGSANTTSSTIKVPRDGYYQVISNIHFYDVGTGGNQSFCIYYKKNNVIISGFEACFRNTQPQRQASSAVTVLKLVAGDSVSAMLVNVGTQAQTVTGSNLQVVELR
ncbi:hypothetical protein F5984_24595 [Rudanella paleaurantiibacter]|uniref:C1q domain-containing protein n=1 Tax=Rudanella paleaurantiibacter TaxID=2614655 RepID=A0A7J5TSV3_9BACT|nr:hypothetical protein [Rudanella paleaurantiibacter]KAB7726498.1 hypothetical protein F5984_24595 [Rudanella paleaurantiibacter]